jgi:YHS domain-containing protein
MRSFVSLAILFSGCASLPPEPAPGAPEQHCPVCRHRRDFDCLIVDASSRTPHADYAGRIYYFCGEGCRGEFLRAPALFSSTR